MSEESFYDRVLIYPKFKVGDEVVTRVTGLPRKGVVISVLHPVLMPEVQIRLLNKRFNHVEKKMFYFVVFEEASKHVTLKEAMELYSDFSEEDYEEIPEANIASFCEDDLELF